MPRVLFKHIPVYNFTKPLQISVIQKKREEVQYKHTAVMELALIGNKFRKTMPLATLNQPVHIPPHESGWTILPI